jgi:DNA polymerase III epsilon subunit family exonuclease
MNYCIIDIETTGGNRSGNKITEIAIVKTDGFKVIEKFETLLNPERRIPSNITYLTGISNEMVKDAPRFFEVAKKIVELTKDCVFVAHNVFFDYQFIKKEFTELGFNYSRKTFCTVKASRKIFPGHKSYSLGRIAPELGIVNEARHRAMGDAMATFELFKLMKKKERQFNSVEKDQTETRINLPTKISKELVDSIPESCGIYKFYSDEKELLYIGKSKNIKKRILSHFRIDLKRKKDIQLKSLISNIDWLETYDELAALLVEASLIKLHRPKFNVRLKSSRFLFGVYVDGNLLKYGRVKNIDEPLVLVKSKRAAEAKINFIYSKAFGLKPEDTFSTDKDLIKWRKVLGDLNFRSKLRDTLFELEYPSSNFKVEKRCSNYPGNLLISVEDDKLLEVRVYDKEKSLIFKHPIMEDPEIKTIFMSNVKNNRLDITETSESVDYI